MRFLVLSATAALGLCSSVWINEQLASGVQAQPAATTQPTNRLLGSGSTSVQELSPELDASNRKGIATAPPATPKPQVSGGPTLRVGLSTAGGVVEIYAPLGATIREKNGSRALKISPGQMIRCLHEPPTVVENDGFVFRGPISIDSGEQISKAWNHLQINAPIPPRDTDEMRLRVTSDGKNARFGRPYRGDLELFPNRLPEPNKRKGPLAIVNIVSLEEYLKGVVPYEMSPEAPAEALKAQAIGARTTALKFLNSSRFKSGGFDVCDYDACQAYPGTENEKPTTTRAVETTRGLVLRYGGALIDSVYSTNSGGITANAGEVWKTTTPAPYLVSSRDFAPNSELSKIFKPTMTEGDWALYFSRAWDSFAKPDEAAREALRKRRARSAFAARLFGPDDWPEFYRWKREMSQSEVDEAFAKNGFQSVASFTVLERTPSGRIRRLEVRGLAAPTGVPTISGDEAAPAPKSLILEGDSQIRAMFSGRLGSTTALPSSSFVIAPQLQQGAPVSWVLQGAGWGHGVGMCQRGAQNRAKNGASAREILAFYYRGATISTL